MGIESLKKKLILFLISNHILHKFVWLKKTGRVKCKRLLRCDFLNSQLKYLIDIFIIYYFCHIFSYQL